VNKRDLTEADIRTKFITPAILASGWDVMTQLREEAYFTKGRVMVRGKTVARGEANKDHSVALWRSFRKLMSASTSHLRALAGPSLDAPDLSAKLTRAFRLAVRRAKLANGRAVARI
jgi:hypothetical protein